MTGITPIQLSTQKKPSKIIHRAGEITGLAAGVGLALTIASGYSKNINFKKQHKHIAVATAIITAAHVLLPKFIFSKRKASFQ